MKQVNKNYFVRLDLLIVIISIIDGTLATEFDYKNVDSWVQINQQCGGQRQSPINLSNRERNDGDSDVKFSKFNYNNKPLSAKLLNNGHTIKMDFEWDENQTPYLAGGFLGENEYVLDSMNFRWSRNNSRGSEHIIQGSRGAMEMHLVHYNRNYGSVENALNYDDGLAVIGGIFDFPQRRQVRDDWTNYYLAITLPSPAVSEILSNVESVRTSGSSVDIEPFAISDIQPVQLSQTAHMTYLGSLTTPPCTENVLWLLSAYPYVITKEQLQFLQETVEFDHGDDHNNRPIQPSNGRKFAIMFGIPEIIG